LDDDSDLPQKLFNGNKKLRQQTLMQQQWPPEEVPRPPDFGQQQDPLPNGWVSRFNQLFGEEYFFCEETEDLVFSREDLFRKKTATNSISSRRSVSSPARTSSTITTTASDRPNSSTRASPCSRKISRPDFVESSFVTPPALGKGASQNDPTIFSDDDDKSFGSADLPNTEDMDMMVATTINRYRGDERQHNNKLRPPTHDTMGATVVLSNLTAVGRSTPRHSNQQRRTRTSPTSMQYDSGSNSSKTLF
jgi:hypothetical protein